MHMSEMPEVVHSDQETHDSGTDTKEKILRKDILHTSQIIWSRNSADHDLFGRLSSYYTGIVDPDSSYIQIYIGSNALAECSNHYKFNGDKNIIGLMDGTNAKHYEFPVFGKIVSIVNVGTSYTCISVLIVELIEQGASRIHAVVDDELVIQKGLEAQHD